MTKPIPAVDNLESLVRTQLKRILAHPEFHATPKMHDFLSFVVEETLAGNTAKIKGFTVATEVYGRDESFDPAHDPVVRIQAGRLRRALERYYLIAGKNDPILIDIPKGRYVPKFTRQLAHAGNNHGHPGSKPENSAVWPSVLVLPFEDMTGLPELAYLAPGLATDLCVELGNCGDLRVILSTVSDPNQCLGELPEFIIQGNVRTSGSTVKVVVQLVASKTGEQLWADTLKTTIASRELLAFQEKAALTISAQIAGEHGAIFREMSRHFDQLNGEDTSAYTAILKGYAYHLKTDEASFLSAVEALRTAHAQDPACGPVCTMYALLHLDNIALDFKDPRLSSLEAALALAREGVRLAPTNQLGRIALIRGLMMNDDLADALQQTEAAIALSPDSLLYMDILGYLLVLLGEPERGEHLIRKAFRLNPWSRAFSRYALWFNRFREGDLEAALGELDGLRGVGAFWDPLARAATLGQLGRRDDSQQAITELLELKPDFPANGRGLMRHYIKMPAVLEKVIEGLAAGGLTLEPEFNADILRPVAYKTLP